MERNEKGRFVGKSVEDEIKETEERLAALKKAQADEVAAKKKAESEAKKAEAQVVETAYQNLNTARRQYNDAVTAAKKVYMEKVNDAKKVYNDAIREAAADLDRAEESYNNALDKFTKEHPEGFHITLRDGDNVKTISRYGDFNLLSTFDAMFDKFLELF